jgi:GT2 family glycosyltransferase
MPVYNAGRYLRKAVDSILAQSFADFEIIAVDDGSSDDSLKILEAYTDHRLIVLKHAENKGIVQTLNTGLARCSGRYIARMDADDIALPERFAQQAAYFDAHPDVGVVDTVQACMDESDQRTGRTNSPVIEAKDIYQTLPKTNCLGHPSVMVRGDLLRTYGYRKVAYEDYDLWLRMAADGIGIVKLKTPLLLFREHSGSITGADHAGARHFQKVIHTKLFYLSGLTFTESMKPFNLRVRAWLLRDIAIHSFKKLKMAGRRA